MSLGENLSSHSPKVVCKIGKNNGTRTPNTNRLYWKIEQQQNERKKTNRNSGRSTPQMANGENVQSHDFKRGIGFGIESTLVFTEHRKQ